MSAALRTAELTDEAIEFVRGGTPRSAHVHLPQGTPTLSGDSESSWEPAKLPEDQGVSTKSAQPSVESKNHREVMVGLSFRVPLDIHRTLMRAAFGRKMAGEEPWTQQEIAAEAIRAWLKKHGYL